MYNGDASETASAIIGPRHIAKVKVGMSHAEPFLLRTFIGDQEKLVEHCTRMLKGEEVIVTCFADINKNQLHERKGKLQRLKASLKKQDYNPKRDFVGWGR